MTSKMYPERELRSRLLTLAWLIVECVDDNIDRTYVHPMPYAP